MKKIIHSFVLIFFICVPVNLTFSYEIPRHDSRVEYMCVFGPDVSRYDGVDVLDRKQVIFFDLPQEATSDFVIEIFDPDTGGKLDEKPLEEKDWDTIVKFSVYGGNDKLLELRNFGESLEFDLDYYRFGPFTKELGEKVNGFYRFRLEVAAINTVVLNGRDANLFNVRVSPDNVESFVYKISLRLLPNEGDEMFFYPEIPAGVKKITVENYDMDRKGGIAMLYDPLTKQSYKIKCSESGAWEQTSIEITASNKPRRLHYIITKQIQNNANATIRVKDDKGNSLPIYFSDIERKTEDRQSEPVIVKATLIEALNADKKAKKEKTKEVPAPAKDTKLNTIPEIKSVEKKKENSLPCNTFTFDASGSYDPDKQVLTYLWDFGDGATSSEPVVTHIYQKGGKYSITLSVDDNAGTICSSSKAFLEVEVNEPPVPLVKIR